MVTVISNEYSTAEDIAKQFAETIKNLPAVDQINVNDHGNTITNLYNLYNSIGDYEKGFLDEDDVKAMNAYVTKLNELLVKLANEAAKEKEKEEAEDSAQQTTDNSSQSVTDDTAAAENAAAQGAV